MASIKNRIERSRASRARRKKFLPYRQENVAFIGHVQRVNPKPQKANVQATGLFAAVFASIFGKKGKKR
jgi:hypothetical protein